MFRRIFAFFALLGVLFNLDAQISIGRYSLSRAVAPPLRASIGAAGFTSGFLAEVGGVAFKQTAHPAPNLTVESIQLRYETGKPDGQRVVAIINGQAVRVNVYDWQLQPVARFANSNDHAVFTLFGKLGDSRREDAVLEKGGRVVNYQRDFQNALLGLRMLQLDNLLASSKGDDLAVELPQEQGRYILAPGESRPDPARNRLALERYSTAVSKNLTEASAHFRSYVVGDSGRDVRFDIESGALHIIGEPGYYFWRYNGDLPAVLDQVKKSVEKRIELAENAARMSHGLNFNEKSWLVQQISAGVARSQGHPISAKAQQELAEEDTNHLAQLFFRLRVKSTLDQPAYKKVEPMTALNNFVNARLAMVKDINPIVWNAATATMRYAAFFRFCKAQNPSNWQEFLGSVNKVRIEPAVETPAVLEIAQVR